MSEKKLSPGQFDAIMSVFGKLLLRINSSDAKKILDNLVEIEIEQNDFESRNGINFCSCPDCASEEANQDIPQNVNERTFQSADRFADNFYKILRNSRKQSLKKQKKFVKQKNKFYPDKILAKRRSRDRDYPKWDREFSIFELLDFKNKWTGNTSSPSKSIRDSQYKAWKRDLIERRKQEDDDFEGQGK